MQVLGHAHQQGAAHRQAVRRQQCPHHVELPGGQRRERPVPQPCSARQSQQVAAEVETLDWHPGLLQRRREVVEQHRLARPGAARHHQPGTAACPHPGQKLLVDPLLAAAQQFQLGRQRGRFLRRGQQVERQARFLSQLPQQPGEQAFVGGGAHVAVHDVAQRRRVAAPGPQLGFQPAQAAALHPACPRRKRGTYLGQGRFPVHVLSLEHSTKERSDFVRAERVDFDEQDGLVKLRSRLVQLRRREWSGWRCCFRHTRNSESCSRAFDKKTLRLFGERSECKTLSRAENGVMRGAVPRIT